MPNIIVINDLTACKNLISVLYVLKLMFPIKVISIKIQGVLCKETVVLHQSLGVGGWRGGNEYVVKLTVLILGNLVTIK